LFKESPAKFTGRGSRPASRNDATPANAQTFPRCHSVIGTRRSTCTQRLNKHAHDLLHPMGWLREGAGLYVQRPDSRTKYQPRIDIPSVHQVPFAAPENLYELHADMSQRANHGRSASALPVSHPGDPSEATKAERRQEMKRTGNHLGSWHSGPTEKYRSILPHGKDVLGSALPHSGLLLPPPLMTSQGFFGPMPNRSGSPSKLRSIAASMPSQLPRFMVHDVKSCTSSAHANFFKTSVAPGANCGGDFSSEHNSSYERPGTQHLRSSNFGARGIKTEMFGKTYESSGQQPWRGAIGH